MVTEGPAHDVFIKLASSHLHRNGRVLDRLRPLLRDWHTCKEFVISL